MKHTSELISRGLIPFYVTHVTETLERAGYEAYIVGGCVRDLLISREPKDWDVTTNATPEEIIPLFEKTVYENKFGTVAVIVSRETNSDVTHVTEPQTFAVEVTPYRTESTYTDARHPDEVKFSKRIEDDLTRRDFTINAMAYSISR